MLYTPFNTARYGRYPLISIVHSFQDKETPELIIRSGVSLMSNQSSLKLNFLFAERVRCFSKTSVVTEPTPRGTGVIIPATSLTSSKTTSPQSFPFSSTLIATSITAAPSATCLRPKVLPCWPCGRWRQGHAPRQRFALCPSP